MSKRPRGAYIGGHTVITPKTSLTADVRAHRVQLITGQQSYDEQLERKLEKREKLAKKIQQDAHAIQKGDANMRRRESAQMKFESDPTEETARELLRISGKVVKGPQRRARRWLKEHGFVWWSHDLVWEKKMARLGRKG